MRKLSEVSVAIGDNGAIVIGSGELDLKISNKFGAALEKAVSSGKPVTVDFFKVEFIDSAILQFLVIYGKALLERGDRLKVITAADSYPSQILRTVGFDCMMDIITERSEGSI
jgi:anti-anti-sigma regulatory factor